MKTIKNHNESRSLMPNYFKSDKEISGYGQLAQHAIFAYHMVRQTPFIALPSLRFPRLVGGSNIAVCTRKLSGKAWEPDPTVKIDCQPGVKLHNIVAATLFFSCHDLFVLAYKGEINNLLH